MYQAFLSETKPGSGLGRPRGMVWRNKQMIMNILNVGGQGDFRTEKVDRILDVMDRIYSTAPVERQSEVARQLAIDNPDLAPNMLFEAYFSGHVAVRKAIESSGKVAFMDVGNPLGSVAAWRESERETMFGAEHVLKEQLVSKWLEDNHDDVDRTDLMFNAAVKGDSQVIKMLLHVGVAPHLDSVPSIVPLHAACFNGNLECAKTLHEAGIDVNHLDEFGGTPLMRAAVGNHASIVRWLLDQGADPSLKRTDEGNYDALMYAAGQDLEIVQMLLDAGAQSSPTAIMAAANHGREAAFDLLLVKAGFPDPEAVIVGRDGREKSPERFSDEQLNALHSSLSLCGPSGSVHIAQRLLKYLSMSSTSDSPTGGAPALMRDLASAAQGTIGEDHAELLALLISSYPRPDQDLNDDDESEGPLLSRQELTNRCLRRAADGNALRCARLLLEKFDADISQPEPLGHGAALHQAARRGHVDMIRMLVSDFKADIHQSCTPAPDGPTPLWMAIHAQQEWAVRCLLELGGPVDFVDDDSLSAAGSSGVRTTQDGRGRVWIAATMGNKYQVRVLNEMDEAWNSDSIEAPPETDRFVCLEFPDGWNTFLAARKVSQELEKATEELPQSG